MPKGPDDQTLHVRDEVHAVTRGGGFFRLEPSASLFLLVISYSCRRAWSTVDKFSDDLVVWVLFHGPECGGKRGP
jgi:hypothetical protein